MAKYELIADIGTDFVNMSLKNTDFVLREPSLALADAQNESVFLAAGLAAKRGAESENAKLVYPFAEGCVADKKAADFFLRKTMEKLLPSTAFPPRLDILCLVPIGAGNGEKKTLEEIFNNIGVKSVRFRESALAAAAACFKEFDKRAGIVVDIGSSVTDLAAVREDKIVAGCSFYLGGAHYTQQIVDYVLKKYGLQITFAQAEKLKLKCAGLYPNDVSYGTVAGVSLSKGVAEEQTITAREIYDVLAGLTDKLCQVVSSLLLTVPQETSSLFKESPIFLCGGGACLSGMEKYFFDKMNMGVLVPSDCFLASVRGAKLLP